MGIKKSSTHFPAFWVFWKDTALPRSPWALYVHLLRSEQLSFFEPRPMKLESLMRQTKLSKRTVIRALNQLRDRGYLREAGVPSPGRVRTFTLAFDCAGMGAAASGMTEAHSREAQKRPKMHRSA
ncbi:MAG TPA: helix-turn-helix domain-containing protein [Gemmatimonadaceae bacterium]|nr:helix-turn-helix domain-containing protein [Gemmatimonadaceae bacterium]